jgi:drug/metabolite transporter (DMT)-like permease
MPRIKSSHFKTDAALLFTVLAWGLNFPILKAALAVMHPFVLNAFRFVASAVALGVVFAVQQRNAPLTVGELIRQYWKQIVGLSILGYILYQISFIVGINNTLAGNAALIMTSSPLWTAAISHVLGLERLHGTAWLGLLVSLTGTIIVIFGGTQEIDFSSETFVGNLIILLAAALWGSYTALSRPVLRYVMPSSLAFLCFMVALPFMALLAAPYANQVAWEQVDAWVWLAIVYSGSLSSGLALVIWNTAVRNVGASQTAVFNNLVPFVALLASFFVLGEPVTAIQVLGGLLIIGGLLLTRRARDPVIRQGPA